MPLAGQNEVIVNTTNKRNRHSPSIAEPPVPDFADIHIPQPGDATVGSDNAPLSDAGLRISTLALPSVALDFSDAPGALTFDFDASGSSADDTPATGVNITFDGHGGSFNVNGRDAAGASTTLSFFDSIESGTGIEEQSVTDVIGIEMMAAVIGDPFGDRALHCHLGDGAEEHPHDGAGAETAMDEQAVHAGADAERGQREHPDERKQLDLADALGDCPDDARDCADVENAEEEVALAQLGLDERAFGDNAGRKLRFRRGDVGLGRGELGVGDGHSRTSNTLGPQ